MLTEAITADLMPPILLQLPKPWFAVRVKSRKEFSVSQMLGQQGFQTLLLQLPSSPNSGPVRAGVPLITGYVFCRFSDAERGTVVRVPSVIDIAGYGKRPVPVSSKEIAALQVIVRNSEHVSPFSGVAVGQRVRIVEGPLRGIEGILNEVKSHRRLVVSVELLQRGVSVDLSDSAVARCSS